MLQGFVRWKMLVRFNAGPAHFVKWRWRHRFTFFEFFVSLARNSTSVRIENKTKTDTVGLKSDVLSVRKTHPKRLDMIELGV